jgi:hypothetical protein
MTLKRVGFAGLGKTQEKRVRVCWAGNQQVRDRREVSESQACGGGGGG